MKNKKIVSVVVIGLLVAGFSFWGGMTYAGNNIKAANASRQGSFSQGGFGGQNGGSRGQGQGGMMRGGGSVVGEVLSVDSTSMTIKLRDGGSKLVLLSPTSRVEKTVDGSISDVTIGKQVAVAGTTNTDGSVSAVSVQIRPLAPVTGATTVKTN